MKGVLVLVSSRDLFRKISLFKAQLKSSIFLSLPPIDSENVSRLMAVIAHMPRDL